MRCILGPEPGYQFEARHGTHAREVAAQGLLKLSSSALSDFTPVHPTASNGAMHSTFVTALVALAFSRLKKTGSTETAVQARLAHAIAESGFAIRVKKDPFWAVGEAIYLAK
jgi:hypothetical protein